MKKIANIVSNNTIDVSEIFNVVKTMDEIQHGLPTLIVGLDLADKLYPDFDITDICLAPNVYWTFKKSQKRDKYSEDLNFFINKVYNNMFKGVTYYFVDLIQNNTKTLKRVIKKIREFKHITTYIHSEMVYLYSDNLIFGIDLKLARYIGMDVNKLITKIKSVSTVFLTDDEILIEYKQNLEEMELQARYIPYLVSIINE